MCCIKEAALDLTIYFLKYMKQDEAADILRGDLVFFHQQRLISRLKKKYESVSEGIAKHGDSTLLSNIYTDLYITQGCSEQVNTEHEVRQIEVASRCYESQEIQVKCTNLFESAEQDKQIRTVLTKGVAGIGKSVSVQKVILDWAKRLEKIKREKVKREKEEESKENDNKKKHNKENQDISFIFPLPFREMNLIEKEKQSLMDLITQFFPETKGLNLTKSDQFKVLFILDGLDECRLPLNFAGNETWRDESSPASLDVLLTNLIKGNLLPCALIWITTRPAAASKIPPECIDRLTEIRGFNDAQKEEYFRKRFTDENLAKEIIDHIKQSKSLFIMCHIPVFCWISATVLQNILEEKRNKDVRNNQSDDASKALLESNTEDIPKTLTQMYTHFFRFQIQQSRRKYDGEYTPDVSWDKDAILSLGKLAFQQLEMNNMIFCDADLEASGIDVSKASMYSGMCTQIFKEEKGIIVGTMYCFVHLSIQEFIAALYAHLFPDIDKKSVFVQDSTEQENKSKAMIDLLKTTVDKALESDNGHLDLFLRFLLGLSLQSNRLLLQGLLTQQDNNDQIKAELVQYIKQKFEANQSPERSINLFYCLNELNDQTLVKDIQTHLSKGSLSSVVLSPAQWSALVFVLLTSKEELEEFELQKFKKSDECLIRLMEVVKTSKKAMLNDCNLTDRCCFTLANVLGSDNSLKELNMNNNNLQDSGVKLLCIGLKSLKCKLEILKLSECTVTEESCSALASVLGSDSSSLKDLDLSNNCLQDSGIKLLSNGLKDNCKLEKLSLSNCSITEEGYKALASALRSNPSHLIELDLTGNDPGTSGVKQLSDLLQDQKCKVKLRFLSPAADEACQFVNGAVGINPLHLRELNLSGHKLKLKTVNQLAALFQDKHCKLSIIQLNNNNITEEGCSALTSVFKLNPSNLIELDLSGNKLGKTGMQNLCFMLKNAQCRLEKLKLSDCSITEESYKILTLTLKPNPSHLIELDLTGNYPGRSGLKCFFSLFEGGTSKLKTISFLRSPAAEEAYKYLTNVLGTNPLLLQKLDLSRIKLGDQDWENISALLLETYCIVEKIKLNSYKMTSKSCSVLATVLSSKTTLTVMNLNNSPLKDSGVKEICKGLTKSKLEKLKLSNCSITEEGYKALALALKSHPSHLIELDLTGNDPGQSGVKTLYDLLQSKTCSLKTLRFLQSPAAEANDHLTSVLQKNLLLLTELNLSKRKLDLKTVNQLAVVLQDKHCKINKILLCGCGLTEESCSAFAKVLRSNSSLKELDMSNNNLQDSGVKKLQNGLENTDCTLEKLRLSNCSITDEGYKALASALRSNPSHLIELDLTGNYPGQSGVKQLNNFLQDQCYKLKTLRFLSSGAENACKYLLDVFGEDPLRVGKLNLSEHKLKDKNMHHLAALLQDKHCQLSTIQLRCCEMSHEGCSAVTSALKSNPSHLRELDLSGNELGQLGMKDLHDLLMNTQSKLEILNLCRCSITEEQCVNLTSALKSNPSHLRELDLSVNQIKNTAVNHLCDLLNDPHFKLERLSLNECGITDVTSLVQSLAEMEALQFLTDLDLSKNDLGDSKEQLRKVLQGTNCKLSLEKEHWFSSRGNRVKGWFRQSKSQKSAKSGRMDQSTLGGAVAGEESGQRTDESDWQESGSAV